MKSRGWSSLGIQVTGYVIRIFIILAVITIIRNFESACPTLDVLDAEDECLDGSDEYYEELQAQAEADFFYDAEEALEMDIRTSILYQAHCDTGCPSIYRKVSKLAQSLMPTPK
jgi:hypothetical protein